MFLGPEIFEASDGITRTDSTAELCALEVLKSCDDDEVAPERTVLWEDTLLSTEPEPEVTLSHEILRQFMEMKNEFDEGPGVSNAIIAADDYECGLLEIENENGFSEDLTIKGDIPSIHPSFGDSSSTLDQASRSFSYDLLHSLPSISTSDQSIRRNQSFGAVPVLPLVDRRALLNNAIPCFPLGPQTPASLFPNVNQIRRVTSQPVFPSFLNPNPSQSVLNPKTPHTMPRNVSSGILHNSESGLTWISKPSSSMPGCVQPQLQQFLASSGGFFQPLPEHSELPHTTSRPPSIKSILGGYIGDGHIYQVLFKRGIRNFVLAPSLVKKGVKVGDYVKVEADRGEDLGKVISRLRLPENGKLLPVTAGQKQHIGLLERERILRLATESELQLIKVKCLDEQRVLEICRLKIEQRNLPMRVVDAEFQFDRHKLTFYFQAEGRIDFRELVRDLFALYKTRIWMQQLEEVAAPFI